MVLTEVCFVSVKVNDFDAHKTTLCIHLDVARLDVTCFDVRAADFLKATGSCARAFGWGRPFA